MSERGFIAIDRGFFDHPIFAPEPYTEREAFQWMIKEAAWSERRIRRGRTMITLSRGQLAHSLRFMATAWQWSEPRVRRFLNKLKSDAMISVLATHESTQITICNYDKYQNLRRTDDEENDASTDAQATHSRRKQEPLNQGTKEDNKNRKARGSRLPDDWMPSLDDIAYALDRGMVRQAVDHQAERFRNYWHARAGPGAVKVNWALTWRNWILKAIEDGNGNGTQAHRNGQGNQRGRSREDAFLAGMARAANRELGDDPLSGGEREEIPAGRVNIDA